MNEVTDALAPVEDGFRAENCFLFGPSGAGKTTVARAAVRELRREVLDLPTAYVNCWADYTRNGVLERIAKELVGAAVRQNAPIRELTETIQAGLTGPAVVILDEVDQISDSKVLYDLHTIHGVAWICIANREIDLLADLDDRIRSRVSVGYSVNFDRYDETTVTEILHRRAREGLDPSAVERSVLKRIAQLAEGDARTAITALRVAARKATSEGLSTIPVRFVESSLVDAKDEVRRKTISKLNPHQRSLFRVLERDGPLIQKHLYEKYREEHADPISLRALRKSHLPKMEHYNLITSSRDNRGRKYRVVPVDSAELTPLEDGE